MMKKSSSSIKVIRDPPKRKLNLVDDSKLPQRKRRALAPINKNAEPENRSVGFLKHGMQLRPRSGTISPESLRKKKKKPSPPPVIKRPESPVEARSSEGMILRPKRKSLEQQPSATVEDGPKRKSLEPATEKGAEDRPWPSALVEALKSKDPVKLPNEDDKIPPMYKGDDPEEAKRNQKERWEWRQARKFQYVGYVFHRSVSPRGFTQREYDICQPFMFKHDFELEDGPVPKDKKYYKELADQVRATKGYGVTLRCAGGVDGTGFRPLKSDLEKNPETMGHLQKMTKLLLPAMNRKSGLTYTAAGVKNLVKASRFYFLTLDVRHTGPATPPQVVEALFIRRPGAAARKFQLLEWKIKQGSTVVFCTADLLQGWA